MKKKKKKKSYKKPEIIYEKKIEMLAKSCDSSWNDPDGCRTAGSCNPFTQGISD